MISYKASSKTGIYVHIPFCSKKCAYCSFYSLCDLSKREFYIDALKKDIEGFFKTKTQVDTIFFGGGTPSLLKTGIKDILKSIKKSTEVSENAEITLEANPETVDEKDLEMYREAGINRISFGVQSFVENELNMLSRIHNASKAEKVLKNARKAGFENISADLMLAIPNQTKDSLLYSVEKAVECEINHLSLYSLKIEKGTALYEAKDSLVLADEEAEWEMYSLACQKLKDFKFKHYEISNFCFDGFECQHNKKYWNLSSYIGFGPSAHSYFDNKRFFCNSTLEEYINGTNIICPEDTDIKSEYIMLGLRTSDGIDISALDNSKQSFIKRLIQNKYAKINKNRLILTEKGMWVSNSIISELI
ncbi:MAG: radical SAM family heme chaperone HemW [Ruminococcaceae bacterium]|nr:radical SAM family heme chaperone HemW [Oscillospiraceae bacterium]